MRKSLARTDREDYWLRLASIKKRQAKQADSLAGVASGIGEYGIANRLWQLEGILLDQVVAMRQSANERRKESEDADAKQGR